MNPKNKKTDSYIRQFYQSGAFSRVTNVIFRTRYCRVHPLYVPAGPFGAPKTRKILLKREKKREKRENVTYLLEIKVKYNKSYSVTRISELGLDCTTKRRRGKKGRKIVLNPKFRRPNIVLYFTARSSELRVTE